MNLDDFILQKKTTPAYKQILFWQELAIYILFFISFLQQRAINFKHFI